MRVLVTGFEPFGGETINPSWEVASALEQSPPAGCRIIAYRLPVARYRAAEQALAAIARERPDVVLSLGQAGLRSRLTPERIAINVDDYRIADHDGNRPQDEVIVADAPAAYFCTLPIRNMVLAMVAAGVPAAVSNTAGTYLCNHVAFSILHALAGQVQRPLAGFVHLPYLPEQVNDRPGEAPSISLQEQVRGIAAGLSGVRDALQATVAKH